MTEKEYRKLEIDSYSTLKDFDDDRKKYYNKYVLKSNVVDKESESLTFGNLVDCLLFSPQDFDSRFLLAGVNAPTGQMGEFVDALYRRTIQSLDENGAVGRTIEVLMQDAYDDVKFDSNGNIVAFKRKGDTYEAIRDKFLGSEAELYYRQKREATGKEVIEINHLRNAESIVEELRTSWITRDIINRVCSEDCEVYDQLPILFEIDGYPMKSLVDKLIIDHKKKIIYFYDLKTCWDNENSFLLNYFKYKYYLQGAIYFLAVTRWAEQEGWVNYKIEYPKFIAVESSNYKSPLIYETTIENIQEGLNGFVANNGKYYPGAEKLISDLKWHKETGIWNISYDNYHLNGIIRIKTFENNGN